MVVNTPDHALLAAALIVLGFGLRMGGTGVAAAVSLATQFNTYGIFVAYPTMMRAYSSVEFQIIVFLLHGYIEYIVHQAIHQKYRQQHPMINGN